MTPLEQAARATRHAQSIFGSQPWSRRVTGDGMDLFAGFTRRIDGVDRRIALLLLAAADGLVTAPPSDAADVDGPHRLIGVPGVPYLVVQIGYAAAVARRDFVAIAE
ncbi:hypothetical protein [Paractinoplanes atraurantiacus]|uniref:Uncharacterized protein n=1 Tax=Paractinoplanes atraurantiacus TaxID=1036182 RepID=A0A285JG50_9ACTN|nr:hypothetical protein [Actinoplanes atraurantiacus]SNY59225.1 hypothetical protein SAMN05421748_12086 [Actinoplanes atraurantiacus]